MQFNIDLTFKLECLVLLYLSIIQVDFTEAVYVFQVANHVLLAKGLLDFLFLSCTRKMAEKIMFHWARGAGSQRLMLQMMMLHMEQR